MGHREALVKFCCLLPSAFFINCNDTSVTSVSHDYGLLYFIINDILLLSYLMTFFFVLKHLQTIFVFHVGKVRHIHFSRLVILVMSSFISCSVFSS